MFGRNTINRMHKQWPLKGWAGENFLRPRCPEKEISEIDGRDVYISQDAHKLSKANGIEAIYGGSEFLAYECTYGLGPSGYEGRLYAQTIGAHRFPRKVRRIPNHGLDVRDFDVGSAHFNISAQPVVKRVVDIAGSYFKLAHVREYLKNRQKDRQ